MTKLEVETLFDTFKFKLQYYQIGQKCLKLLNGNFIFEILYRTRKDHRKWNSKLEKLLEANNIADEDYFRIITIISYDIKFEFICKDDLSKFLQIDVLHNDFTNKDYQEFIDKNYDEQLVVFFIDGKIPKEIQLFSEEKYLQLKRERFNIVGIWKNNNIYYEFKYGEVFTNDINDNYHEGKYVLTDDLIIIEYKTSGIKGKKIKELLSFQKDLNSLIIDNITSKERFYLGRCTTENLPNFYVHLPDREKIF
ncbi:hypothetical protein [Flavobacterium litorale]|uniref:Uncharacterized protein n=1 Tax=Flavobacterium litorale TaxID=2856519 RepID=A0ABX8V894_9FLAO|nr:hypothetical protein [Flavobacterium litorale]QYJ68732.1 hypothetical protein K1I41_02295 [Flavobacterium litorale]